MRLMKSFLIMMILLMGVVTAFAQQELVLGDTVTVDASGMEMEFEFDAVAGDELVISATSADFDTLITVLDDQGNVIDSDDDSGERFNSELAFTSPADATYTLVVSDAFGQELTGTVEVGLLLPSALLEDPVVEATMETETIEATPQASMGCVETTGDDTIGVGECYTGVAEDANAFYTLNLTADETVQITAESDAFDTYLELFDVNGRLVADDDDSAGDLNSQIVFTAPEDGTYEIVVRGAFDRNADGAYSVTVLSADAAASSSQGSTGNVIEPGMDVEGTYNGEYVEYSFNAQAGTMYSITLSSPDFDTYLELYDVNDNYVAEDDDGADTGTDSRLSFSPMTTGTYVIKVRSFGMSGSGSYTLSLSTVEAVALTVDEPYTVEAGSDERIFTFEASADQVYDLYALSAGEDDLYMTLYDPSGSEISYDDDNGYQSNPFFRALNLPEDGTYRVEISSYSDEELTSDFTVYFEESERLFIDDEPTSFTVGDRADVEVVAFDVKAGETYRLVLEVDRDDLYVYGDMLQPEESGMSYSVASFSLNNMRRGVFDMDAEYNGLMRVVIDFSLYNESANATVSVTRVTEE